MKGRLKVSIWRYASRQRVNVMKSKGAGNFICLMGKTQLDLPLSSLNWIGSVRLGWIWRFLLLFCWGLELAGL